MFNLIRKEFLVQKRTFLLAALYSIFVFLVFQSVPMNETVYIAGSAAIAYMLVMNASYVDDKNKSEILLNSLPVQRKEIVRAKYVTAYIYAVFGIGLTAAAGTALKIFTLNNGINLNVRYITPWDIVPALFSVGLLVALHYPLYFKFGYRISRIINIALFMAVFFLPGILIGMAQGGNPQVAGYVKVISENAFFWTALSLGIMLIVVLVSYGISVRLYLNKDL